MTEEQMRERSAAKVKQVMEMMKILHLRTEARERINEQGFIEKVVYWMDDEQYKPAEPIGPSGGAPTGEAHA